MKFAACIATIHLLFALSAAATLGQRNTEPAHFDWHKGKYLTKLQNPDNDCDDGSWGFVAINDQVYKTDHKICNITVLHKNVAAWHAETQAGTLQPRIPNPVIYAGTSQLIGGSTITAHITLGTVVSLTAIGAVVGGVLFGVAWLGKKIVNTINSRDEAHQGDLQFREVKQGMFLGSSSLSKRGSEEIALCVSGNNDPEEAEGDDKSNRDVDNSISTQCAQDIHDAGAAGGECSLSFTAGDGSTTTSQDIFIADTSVDYNSACCNKLGVC